jgi:heme-degrading monooxygenase HmoA
VPEPFVYLWTYQVSPERTADFQELHGPNGAWVGLFRRAAGYLDTQLLQDRSDPSRFVTIDRWDSEEAFASFRESFAEEFDHLDRLGERLTVEETALGEFRPAGTTVKPERRP